MIKWRALATILVFLLGLALTSSSYGQEPPTTRLVATCRGSITEGALAIELSQAGYLGPWELESMVAAFNRASCPSSIPSSSRNQLCLVLDGGRLRINGIQADCLESTPQCSEGLSNEGNFCVGSSDLIGKTHGEAPPLVGSAQLWPCEVAEKVEQKQSCRSSSLYCEPLSGYWRLTIKRETGCNPSGVHDEQGCSYVLQPTGQFFGDPECRFLSFEWPKPTPCCDDDKQIPGGK